MPHLSLQEERYTQIVKEMRNMLVKTGWLEAFVTASVPFVPMSGIP